MSLILLLTLSVLIAVEGSWSIGIFHHWTFITVIILVLIAVGLTSVNDFSHRSFSAFLSHSGIFLVLFAGLFGAPDCTDAIMRVYEGERGEHIAIDDKGNAVPLPFSVLLEDGGADHADERVSEGIGGLKGGVNAPTVYNSVFNVRQFWNGRAADLREQAEGPATNPVEMGDQTWDQICERLRTDKVLVEEFERLYPGEGLTKMTVTGAIAEFERTLITPGSRFDKYLEGNREAISPEETRGYEKFKENACATCHTGVILGGRSFEFLDIYGDYFADRTDEIAYNSDDDGLKGFTGKNGDLHKFKVPGLRNVALTAPYFHDGTFQTLEAAVKAMARYELGKELSDQDICSIVAFLNTLTSVPD